MNEYFFKVYFKDNETGVPFVVPVSKVSSTLEAAKQRLFAECHVCEKAHNCKLLYIYYDTDLAEAMHKQALKTWGDIITKIALKEGAANED